MIIIATVDQNLQNRNHSPEYCPLTTKMLFSSTVDNFIKRESCGPGLSAIGLMPSLCIVRKRGWARDYSAITSEWVNIIEYRRVHVHSTDYVRKLVDLSTITIQSRTCTHAQRDRGALSRMTHVRYIRVPVCCTTNYLIKFSAASKWENKLGVHLVQSSLSFST